MIQQSRNAIAVPPGETIREMLEAREMQQKELACRIGMTPKFVSNLVNGIASLSDQTAIKLESVLGMPAVFWANLEANYRIDLAKVDDERSMEEEESIARKSPYAECVKHGWLPDAHKAADKVRNLRVYFGVAKLQTVLDPQSALLPQVAYRRLDDKDCHDMARAIWVQKARDCASKFQLERLNLQKLEQMIPQFRALTMEDPAEFHPKLIKDCASCGVALVVLPCLSGSGIQGASFTIGAHVALALTVRGNWADVFWFGFFHELGHILEMDFEQPNSNPKEQDSRADQFARDTLIPANEYKKLGYLPLTAESIRTFSEKIGIDTGIVVGRLQKEGLIEYNQLTNLKSQYKLRAA